MKGKEVERRIEELTTSVVQIQPRLRQLEEDAEKRKWEVIAPKQPPVLFQAKCGKCEEVTAHISHLTSEVYYPSVWGGATMIASSAQILSGKRPIKTCLACGTTTRFT